MGCVEVRLALVQLREAAESRKNNPPTFNSSIKLDCFPSVLLGNGNETLQLKCNLKEFMWFTG